MVALVLGLFIGMPSLFVDYLFSKQVLSILVLVHDLDFFLGE